MNIVLCVLKINQVDIVTDSKAELESSKAWRTIPAGCGVNPTVCCQTS
jgi:hypothetical protein